MPVQLAHDKYPIARARRDASVVDTFGTVKVADPYRWLEDPDAEETKNYVNELNKVSVPFLEACPLRTKVSERLTNLWDHAKYGLTSKHGKHYFYSYNPGLLNQSVMYIGDSASDQGRVFLDPNQLSSDGTTHIRVKSFTKDGSLFAYGLSDSGSDWTTLKFMKVPSGDAVPDVLKRLKYTGASFTHDNQGIFYSGYAKEQESMDGTATEKASHHTLYYHKMGTDQSEDIVVVQFKDQPDYMIDGTVSEDGQYLIVTVSKGCDPHNLLFVLSLADWLQKPQPTPKLTPIVDQYHAKYEYIDNNGKQFLIMTNRNAPMFKLMSMNLDTADEDKWDVVINEDEKVKLDWVAVVAGDKLVVCTMRDVKNELRVHSYKGQVLHEIPLNIGCVGGFSGEKHLDEFFYRFDSFTTPGIIYRVQLTEGQALKSEELRRINVPGFDADSVMVKQEWCTSADGVKVPMYIIHHKDVDMSSGSAPTVLYGYGGFNISLLPGFSISRSMFLQNLKGVYVIANLRGGSEFGEKWHEGGMLANKQNVFNDFIAAAQHLIHTKVTSPNRLCIQGGSNGGLLVGACANQRPDLFGAVINQVGVNDMLRYHKFTIGGAWQPEFGCPDQPEHFANIYKYSPLHNLRMPVEGQLPAMLLCTADHDDRVVPLHSLKYTAQLYHTVQNESRQTNPLLCRVEVKAGHGAGKPTTKVIEELTDLYSFLIRVFDMQWNE